MFRSDFYPSASIIVERLEWAHEAYYSGPVHLDDAVVASYLLSPRNGKRKILAALRSCPIKRIWVTRSVVSLPNGCRGEDLIWIHCLRPLVLLHPGRHHMFPSVEMIITKYFQAAATERGILPRLTTLRLQIPAQYHACIAALVPELKALEPICFGYINFVIPSKRMPLDGRAMQSILRMDAPLALELKHVNFMDQAEWQSFCNELSQVGIHSLRFWRCTMGNMAMLEHALIGSHLKELRIVSSDAQTRLWPDYSHVLGALAHAISLMPYLEELACGGPWEREKQNPQELVDLVHAAARCEQLLRFRLCIYAYDAVLDQALASYIASNTGLQELGIKYEPCDELGTPKVATPALHTALTKNYIIQLVSLTSPYFEPWDASDLETIKALVRLSNAGRWYMASNPSDRPSGVRVLEQVADDMGCLFLHVRENPILRASVESGMAGKPARAQHGDGVILGACKQPREKVVCNMTCHIL